MTFKTNLLLAAMLLALAGFVYLYEIRGGEEREKSEPGMKEKDDKDENRRPGSIEKREEPLAA